MRRSGRSPPSPLRRRSALRDGIDVATPIFMEALEATTNKHAGGSHWMFSPDLACALAEEGRRDELDGWYRKVNQLSIADPSPITGRRTTSASATSLWQGTRTPLRSNGSPRPEPPTRPCPALSREAEALLAMSNLLWRSDRVARQLERCP